MLSILAAVLIATPEPTPGRAAAVYLRLDPVTRCAEVWTPGGELIAEYEPRDGAIYSELVAVMGDARRPRIHYDSTMILARR